MHPASEPGAAALSAAYRYIDAHHRGDCGQTQNVLLFCLTGVPKQKDVQRNGYYTPELAAAVTQYAKSDLEHFGYPVWDGNVENPWF